MVLKEKSLAVVNYLKANGRVTVDELAEALGTTTKSVNGTITSLGCNGPHAKGLVDYEKVRPEGAEKDVKYVFLTDAGIAFEQGTEE